MDHTYFIINAGARQPGPATTYLTDFGVCLRCSHPLDLSQASCAPCLHVELFASRSDSSGTGMVFRLRMLV